ncbi:ribosomal protection-like ABC-F family protein [Psychrobacillus antarcticus]|uniref:ribosomal protection-like ABC-F family protein n=1 Tax=Psychrobacillus antarcticus TaxID=2879115 RepID=UPI00240819C6|nr:ABC-F type ribosomal protection protein [Psychrobacillus antarcticus]
MPIDIQHLHFGFDTMDRKLFEDVSLTIDTKWCLGLIGRNGRGKSTLLKLLMHDYLYSGEIRSDVEFVYFPQSIPNKETLVYYAIDEVMPVELWKIERECQLLGLDKEILWQPFEQLSGGEQTKVLLAALFCEDSRYPLLDEPTNHLDIEARKTVANYLKKKKGFIVVSHDRNFVDSVVDHILVIEKSQLVLYKGDFSTYEQQKQLQDEYELEQNKVLKSEIDRLQKTANEKSSWAAKREKPSGNDPFGNAIAKRMNKRAKAIEKRTNEKVEEKTDLLKNIEKVSDLKINCQFSHRNPVLVVKKFTICYDGKPLFHPITFNIFQNEQVALVGPNGSGKTSILNYLILQQYTGTITGEVAIPNGLTQSNIRQNHDDNKGLVKAFADRYDIDYSLFLNNLRILGVERDIFNVPIENMSNGQQKKVEFAKSLGLPAEFYIWDEPLNYLDVFNQTQIEKMILEYKPTLLFVEHDQNFIANIASKTVEIIPY